MPQLDVFGVVVKDMARSIGFYRRLGLAFPDGAESLHYSSCEFQTRVTEMKVITRHESPDTLILIEVPVLPGAAQCFPRNAVDYAYAEGLTIVAAAAFTAYRLRRSR